MNNILLKFSFWFFLISFVIVVYSILGYDDKNLYIESSNPILYSDLFKNIVWDDVGDKPNSFFYITHILMYTFSGMIIDFIIKKNSK